MLHALSVVSFLTLVNYPVMYVLLEAGAWAKRNNKTILFYSIATPFMGLDFWFQYTWGSFLFREWPAKGEHTFSARIRRYRRDIVASESYDEEKYYHVAYWKAFLNKRLPGHIDI